MRFYDNNQVKALLETALEIKDRFYSLYYLAIHTAMRQGELLGLKWKDVDWKNSTLQVNRQVVYQDGVGFQFLKPKNNSKRTITIGHQALNILKKQQTDIESLKTRVAEEWTDLDLVFPFLKGTPMRASNIRRGFGRLLEISELPENSISRSSSYCGIPNAKSWDFSIECI